MTMGLGYTNPMNRLTISIVVMITGVFCAAADRTYALDARTYVQRAVELIEAQQYTLARTYLEPALIDPRLHSGERSRAYYLRGFSFMAQGMPVSARKDYNRALEFNPKNAVVVLELGLLHGAGNGVEQDEALALSLYEQAVALGYQRAQFYVGRAYLFGRGVEKNIETARASLTAAAEADHLYAMMNLAASYRAPHDAEPQPELALAWYEKAIEGGEHAALLSIGFMHANGEFGEADPVQAVALFRQALDEGIAAAAVHLAYAHLTGTGVEKNPELARALYIEAADAGVVPAYVGLGHLYEFGLGVAKDRALARQWYEKGAALGQEEAMLRLVSFHLQRDGEVARGEALKWSRLAALQGSAQAVNDYAWLLATSKVDDMRNGTLALDQAIKAVDLQASAAYLDTLAAAYAELGNFEQAVSTQRQAIASITSDEDGIAEDLQERLQYYERSEPWRE